MSKIIQIRKQESGTRPLRLVLQFILQPAGSILKAGQGIWRVGAYGCIWKDPTIWVANLNIKCEDMKFLIKWRDLKVYEVQDLQLSANIKVMVVLVFFLKHIAQTWLV